MTNLACLFTYILTQSGIRAIDGWIVRQIESPQKSSSSLYHGSLDAVANFDGERALSVGRVVRRSMERHRGMETRK